MTQTDPTPRPRYHEWTRADRLRIAREYVTNSQLQFGLMAGISKNTVSRYETLADIKVKQPFIEAWARVTGFSVQWLLTGIPEEGAAPATAPNTGGEPANELIAA